MELKILRIRAGLSQAEAGKLAGVNQATVSCWERGDYKPSPAVRARLADAYGVSLAEIVRAVEQDAAAREDSGGDAAAEE